MMGNSHNNGSNNAMMTAAMTQQQIKKLYYIDDCDGAKIDTMILTERR
jgi:hypothetical protein